MMVRRLDSADLKNFSLPEGPFLVPPRGYRVVDGDTIKLISGHKDALGKEVPLLSLRFRSIATPEIRRSSWSDMPFVAIGQDPNRDCPGRRAQEMLRNFTKGRSIIVSHQKMRDPYGRLLCDISVLPRRDSPVSEAVSLERVMVARGVATRFNLAETMPSLHPFGDNLSLRP